MGIITIEYGLRGKLQQSFIQDVVSKQAGVDLATALDAYSNASIVRLGYTENVIIGTAENLAEQEQSVDIIGLTQFRNEEGALVRLAVPAPKLSDYTLDSRGYRLIPAKGAALASLYGAAIEQTLVYIKGSVCGSSD